jgi:hypothetical protein
MDMNKKRFFADKDRSLRKLYRKRLRRLPMRKKGQVNVIYMSYFILLSLVFLAFILALSDNFKEDSSDEIKEYIADNVFSRIEQASLELKSIQTQTSADNLIKIVSIPRRLGENSYQIIGKNNSLIIQSSGSSEFYKVKPINWKEFTFEGSTNSQDAQIKLLLNITSNKIVIS